MIFRQYRKVLTGEKTETRRAAHDGENAGYFDAELTIVRNILNPSKTTRYAVGKTYPVIPKMFQPAIIWCPDHPCYGIDIIEMGDSHYALAKSGEWVYAGQGYIKAQIRIIALRWREPLHDIDHAGALREGVSSLDEYRDLWESINGKSRKYRWTANPLVNVIRFEAVRP